MIAALLHQRNSFATALLAAALAAAVLAHRPPEVREVAALEAQLLAASGALVVDVRAPSVAAAAHLPGALLVPLDTLVAHLEARHVDKSAPIVVYCGQGSALGPRAAQALQQAGYVNAANLQGGIQGWRAAGLPVHGG